MKEHSSECFFVKGYLFYMATILEEIKTHEFWEEFLAFKAGRKTLRKAELEDFEAFVEQQEYRKVTDSLGNGYVFSNPSMFEISKSGTNRKRTVYSFGREENYVLKGIAYLLHRYDGAFCSNPYSFRRSKSVRGAVSGVISKFDLSRVYTYKVDIHDYFNSIDVEGVLAMLKSILVQDEDLYCVFEQVLRNPCVVHNGVRENKDHGVMAGTPFAGFLANVYLSDMDKWFEEREISYYRYSDDIIVISESEGVVRESAKVIADFLARKILVVNEEKQSETAPGEEFEFLGFRLSPGKIDVSGHSMKKIKAKLRRKSHAIYRWRIRKGLEGAKGAKAFVKYLNRKFYDNPVKDESTWCRWYFPLVSTDESLKILDQYAVQCIRYIYTGRYSKINYRTSYEEIRNLGYKSLVNSYWKYRNGESTVV